jgi:A/G-specific adenine glycosylase
MKLCKARQHGTQNERPVLSPKKDVPHYVHAAGVIVRRIGNPPHEEVLLAQRPSQGLLGGMWEFPNGRVNGDPARELPNALKMGYKLRVRLKHNASTHRHLRAVQVSPTAPLTTVPMRFGSAKGSLGTVKHGYSHFSVTVHVFRCELISGPKETNLKWVSLNKLQDYPMGKIDRQIARMIAK